MKKGNKARRAAGYIRVSQERAARNGYGLGAQEHEIKRFIEYKKYTYAQIYRENGVSGYTRERPAMDRLLADAKAGRFDIVVFPSIDRAGRSVRDVIEIDQALRSAGVDTVFLREGVDTSTPTGQLFRNIMASLAEFEGRVIYERLSKGKLRKASEGGYTGGWIPYGYRKDENGELVVIPEEAAVIQRIYKWKTEGQSFPWIARQLIAEGVSTRNGGTWRPSTLRGILNNHFYTGRAEFEGKLIKAPHEPIVSVRAFRACQRAFNSS